jgi:hypothetical protein
VLSIRTTGTAVGHGPVTLTSEPTAPTAPSPPTAKAVTGLKATAKAKRRVVVLTVRATAPGLVPTGKIVIKARGKVVARVTLRAGTGKVRIKGLRPGRTTFAASYGGDAATGAAATKVTVKVPRR